MLDRILQTALLAASASAMAWQGASTRLIDGTYTTVATTDIRTQINSSGTTLMQKVDGSMTLASASDDSTYTDAVACVNNGKQGTSASDWVDNYMCYHFVSKNHTGSTGRVEMYMFMDDDIPAFSEDEAPVSTELNYTGTVRNPTCSYVATKATGSIAFTQMQGACVGAKMASEDFSLTDNYYSARALYNITATDDAQLT